MNLPKETMEILQALAPELAESEDERIRRWLCDYFSSIDKAWIHKDITCIDILRWLEKQKEQKKEKFPPYVTGFKGHPDPAGTSGLEEAAEKYIQGSMCDLDDGPTVGLAKEAFIAGAKWQKEQKPVEIHVDNPNIEKFDPDVKITTSDSSADGKELLYVCNKSYDIGFRDGVASVKPAEWSEEDEKDMAHIIRILDDCYVYGTHDLSKTDRENLVNKLKSLRPQPKPEWSEEDEENLEKVIWYIEKGCKLIFQKPDKLISWLKSLRPQPHWKPSEEQMKALSDACCIAFEEERDFHPSLSRLYHDLRKL